MLKDFARPNGTIKRTQYVKAPRKGISSMGAPYKKGDAIVHLSSSRCTGETFVLLPNEIIKFLYKKERHLDAGLGGLKRPGRWARPKDWSEHLSERWEAAYLKAFGHAFGKQSECKRCGMGGDRHPGAGDKMRELLKKTT